MAEGGSEHEPTPPDAVAFAIRLIRVLDATGKRDLERLLAADLALPTAAELREARLGTLVDMLGDNGEAPSAPGYEIERERVARLPGVGKPPAASTLLRAYGDDWDRVVKAAYELRKYGSASRVKTTHKCARGGRVKDNSYTREEVFAAIIRFRDSHQGTWPSGNQYFKWAGTLRRRAREGGHPDPRLPSASGIKPHFKRFADAVTAAKRRPGSSCQ
jgi:hypothetical protein